MPYFKRAVVTEKLNKLIAVSSRGGARDRIDSAGHCSTDNFQIVSRTINPRKRDDDDALFRRLLGVLNAAKEA